MKKTIIAAVVMFSLVSAKAYAASFEADRAESGKVFAEFNDAKEAAAPVAAGGSAETGGAAQGSLPPADTTKAAGTAAPAGTAAAPVASVAKTELAAGVPALSSQTKEPVKEKKEPNMLLLYGKMAAVAISTVLVVVDAPLALAGAAVALSLLLVFGIKDR